MNNQKLTLEEIQKRGGQGYKRKYGKEGYAEMGRKGHLARMEKYGKEYYSRIGKISAEKRKQRQAEAKRKKTPQEILNAMFGLKELK